MVSIQEYANKYNVSYEAIRKQIKRNAKELEGHISKQNRKQYLDEYAEKYLDEKRDKNPVIVMKQAESEELEQARAEAEQLKLTIMELQQQLAESKDRIISLQNEQLALIEERGKNQLLLELKDKSDKELEQMQKELSSYKKSLFGFYRKVENITES